MAHMREVHPDKQPGNMECPECKAQGVVRKFNMPHTLANHRRAAHQVKSQNQLDNERKQQKKLAKIGVPVVPEVAMEKENHEPPTIEARQQIDPIIFALTVGRVKELCRHIAEEHDVPTRLFTRQFSQLFLQEARR
jgi:hypothetical protein